MESSVGSQNGQRREMGGPEKVRLQVALTPVVNYALQQNRMPVLRSVRVENGEDVPLENLTLEMTCTPELCLPLKHQIALVPARETLTVRDVRLILDGAYLAGLTEKVTGVLRVTLSREGQVLCEENLELTALAFDQWHGSGFYPELLTAFVVPNHPEVARICARAAQLLGKWSGDPSLDAYQTQNPDRVVLQAAAVYGALQEQNLIYAVAPAGFEEVGQRVRLSDSVLQQKMGNCLDLTLLYAACLESIGLNPLLILLEEHIYGGVWLEEHTFPEAVQSDGSLLTRRLARGSRELAVLECTYFTAGKRASFDEACEEASRQLLGADAIDYIVDVKRARLSGLSPLPQRIPTEDGWTVRQDVLEESRQIAQADAGTGETSSRMQQWERRLLDLGLRNTLINMRLTRSMVPLLAGSLDELEDALASGNDFAIFPRPEDWPMKQEEAGFENLHALGDMEVLIRGEVQSRRLRSILTETELGRTVTQLYRSARSALEENGANALYLAMGLLRWYETERSTKPRYAPVILIPVELVRRKAGQGYLIRMRDDEPQMNITILEKLKQDFGIQVPDLDPLPQDEHGVDTRRVFTALRQAVAEQQGWEVLESACLGIFSFSRFVMWNDIRNRAEDLARSKVVRSLMENRLCWDATAMDMGEKVEEDSVLLPIPADASQLYAIDAARKGTSFVLHGPPGTGKSQTITALIANALAQGQTVLFVAEKMAALDVVRRRLAGIGLDPFCLELHSNRSRKRDVLSQLKQALEVTRGLTCEQYAGKAEQMAAMRQDLGRYVERLHRKQPCGLSVHQLIERWEADRDAPDLEPFSPQAVAAMTPERVEQQQMAVQRLMAAARAAGHPSGHPLRAVRCTRYSQSLRMQLPEAVQSYQWALVETKHAAAAFARILGQEMPGDREGLSRLVETAQLLQPWTLYPAEWARQEQVERYLEQVETMAEHFLAAGLHRRNLSGRWQESFFSQDGEALQQEYSEIAGRWLLARSMGMSALARRLAVYARGPVDRNALASDLSELTAMQSERKHAQQLYQVCGSGLGNLWEGEQTDWNRVRRWAVQAAKDARALDALTGSSALRTRLGGRQDVAEPVQQLLDGWSLLQESGSRVRGLIGDLETGSSRDWLESQKAACGEILEHFNLLREWISWNAAAAEAEQLDLGNLTLACRRGLPLNRMEAAFRKAQAYALAVAAIEGDPVLNTFSGSVFNEKIRQFSHLDRQMENLTRREIFCRLAAAVPDGTREAAQSSEMGILQRAIRSGGRGISIRRLFEQIPNLLPRLCPCMLMSPISAAQYLDPKRELFDIVVFDEASQLPTCKAVGALARGRNAVIVGDPRQMPPTAFFTASGADEDNLEMEDLESILDDCLALNMPQTHLLWHYRSRHESLIAFSNSRFYENRLFTFPSVSERDSRVSLRFVHGVFDRGRTRQNPIEAQAVVEEMIRRCHDPERCGFSVGVVTFNISQQNLIEDLLTEACRSDPDLEEWAYSSPEPVFIKNLENVQGDERDVILFSVGYGPDKDGKVYMNFGPLNRDGGWRRLNVAVSRSRYEMVVFSSLSPERISLTQSSAEGVAALKAFLSYAASGRLEVDERAVRPFQKERDAVAEAICGKLQALGYRTDRQVGHSEFRVDIAVVSPANPRQYLLGILLDGESYRAARTVRDRELGQIGVLKGLGWNIHRIWTMDWWDSPDRETEILTSLLKELAGRPASTSPAPVRSAAPVSPAAKPPKVERKETSLPEPPRAAEPYRAARLPQDSLTSEEMLYVRSQELLEKKIRAVIQQEAPVCESLLIRRVAQSCGIVRIGVRIQGRLRQLCEDMRLACTRQGDQTFYWRSEEEIEEYDRFRATGTGADRREAREIPVQEAANALCKILEIQVGMKQEDLIREGCRWLGYMRVSPVLNSLFTQAIAYAKKRRRIRMAANGNWILRG